MPKRWLGDAVIDAYLGTTAPAPAAAPAPAPAPAAAPLAPAPAPAPAPGQLVPALDAIDVGTTWFRSIRRMKAGTCTR